MARWMISHRADPRAVSIADRHYSRQKPGTSQFVPPGRCVVLITPDADAVWVTSWPFAEYVKHAWAGAWMCSIFRNESPFLSSDLIVEAIAVTRYLWPDIPAKGIVTFIDVERTKRRRGKRNPPGHCFLEAGFNPAIPSMTKGGLVALQMLPQDMPAPAAPFSYQLRLAVA